MKNEKNEVQRKDYFSRTVSLITLFIATTALIIAFLAANWARENSDRIETVRDAQTTTREADPPPEPSNPNVQGGSNAIGTGQSNDEDIETPSPAGGIDTDGDIQR